LFRIHKPSAGAAKRGTYQVQLGRTWLLREVEALGQEWLCKHRIFTYGEVRSELQDMILQSQKEGHARGVVVMTDQPFAATEFGHFSLLVWLAAHEGGSPTLLLLDSNLQTEPNLFSPERPAAGPPTNRQPRQFADFMPDAAWHYNAVDVRLATSYSAIAYMLCGTTLCCYCCCCGCCGCCCCGCCCGCCCCCCVYTSFRGQLLCCCCC
ncbi:unnamed protein product, partial [Polarella glacialis]